MIRDNIIVICQSSTHESFKLFLCDKMVHTIKESFINGQGQTWYEGDNVIGGLWYEWLRLGSHTYYLHENSPIAWVFSHSIITSKFPMPPTIHMVRGNSATYELFKEFFKRFQGSLKKALKPSNWLMMPRIFHPPIGNFNDTQPTIGPNTI